MGMEKYQKVKKIGEGSFGKAYLVKAKDQPGKQFVIKEINMGKMGRKEREESRKEVAVLSQMQHPNIVSYRESFEEISNLYIVMDFCDGGDLYSKINAQRGILFPEDQILDWFVQICLSIKHIHDRKILHRDIKSQNIFMTRAGIVKLGDFGIAKVLNSTVELARTCIGTPYYLSPEICENRPYNNKSDIWSLGCVLYELATLKHAFEAGNMKNLVLKIIRGSYPPVAPKYSYELRMLVAQLFKRNPRDRPSISAVLKKPFVQRRIQKFLSETELQSEFSHTVMHGHKIHKQLPLGPAVKQPAARPVVAGAKRPISAPVKRYNPANIYGRPAAAAGVRKSGDKENRSSAEKKRPPSGAAGGGVAGALNPQRNDDVNKRRQELVERERNRRKIDDQKKADYARQHRDLIEKQRMARIKKGREDGWKNLVSSLNSNNEEEVSQPVNEQGVNERGDYEKYHAYLEKIQGEQEERMRAAAAGDAHDPMDVDVPSARPLADWPDKDAVKREIDRSEDAGFRFAEEARVKAGEAAERAKKVEEYLSRKREAAFNKQRVKANIFGHQPPSYDGAPVQKQARPEASGRNQEEQDYLARLRQIRLQNFQERRAVRARQSGDDHVSQALGDPKFDPEARRKKIEALRIFGNISFPATPLKETRCFRRSRELNKNQADARAKQIKDQLEKKREDVFAKQKQRWKQQQEKQQQQQGPSRAVSDKPAQRAVGGAQRAVSQNAGPQRAVGGDYQRAVPQRATPMQPNPGLTNVMQAIGAQPNEKPIVSAGVAPAPAMTNVFAAIGAQPSEKPFVSAGGVGPAGGMTNIFAAIGIDTEQNDAPDDDINDTSIQQQKKDILKKLNEKSPPARGKWGAPIQPAEELAAERPKWGQAPVNLQGLGLEETASNMEATNAGDFVTKNPDERPLPVRKQWGGAAGTALNALQGANIIDSSTVKISDTNPPAGPAISGLTQNISSPSHPKTAWEKSEKSDAKSPRPLTPKSSKQSVSPRPVTPKTPKQSSPASASKESKSGEKPADGEKVVTPQRLFEKVQLDEDDEGKVEATDLELEEIDDDVEDSVPAVLSSLKGDSAEVVIGLTTGHFDVPLKSMLRTCSMPDLSKLFHTVDNPFMQDLVAVSVDVAYLGGGDSQDEDTQDEDKQTPEAEEHTPEGEEEDEQKQEESDDEDDFDEADEEDMKSLRETMEKLLKGGVSNKKPKKSKAPHNGSSDCVDGAEAPPSESVDETDSVPEIRGTIIPGKEEWESDNDNDEDGNDTMFGDSEEDTFCRLEQSRLELEDQLGCDVFMKAYKTVQALHEDEDEAVEDGHKMVSTLLGKPNEHLYQKILNLVLADGAYLEDND